ncbi:DUF5060 domain-containing protein [Asticcacaulis aquaticus]
MWDRFELSLTGPKTDNSFINHTIKAVFTQGNRAVTVDGFYDGDGIY